MLPLHTMKTILALLLLAHTAIAAEVSLEWTASPDAVGGYAVYYGNTTTVTPLQPPLRVATDKTSATLVLPEGGKWFFAVVALNQEGVESEPSPTITTTIPTAPASIKVTTVSAPFTNIYYLKK